MRLARGCGKWPMAQVSRGQWWCGFFVRRRIYDRIAGFISKRYFAKRYLRASFIQINRRSSRRCSLFQLDDDEIPTLRLLFRRARVRGSANPRNLERRCSCAILGRQNLRPALRGKRRVSDLPRPKLHFESYRCSFWPPPINALIFRGESISSAFASVPKPKTISAVSPIFSQGVHVQ